MPKVAVTVAAESAVTLPTTALKTLVVLPDNTTILPGTVSKVELEVSPTVVSMGTGCDRVTVQELVASDIPPLGLQTSAVIIGGATSEIVTDCVEPLYVAVREPLWFTVNEPACRLTEAELDSAAIISDAGVVRTLLVLDRATFAPPVSAALVRVTVQVLEAFCPRVTGLQVSDDTRTAADKLIVAFAELLL